MAKRHVLRLSRNALFALVAVGVIVCDQVSKWFAISRLTTAFAPEYNALSFGQAWSRFLWTQHPARTAPAAVFENFWHFRYVENPGAAWGFLAQSLSAWRTPFFLCVSLSAMAVIIGTHRRAGPQQKALRLGLAMVFGGAIGNFIDRSRLGYVIDFIDWHYYDKAAWPTFNVADAGITVGVAILLLDMFFESNRK